MCEKHPEERVHFGTHNVWWGMVIYILVTDLKIATEVWNFSKKFDNNHDKTRKLLFFI